MLSAFDELLLHQLRKMLAESEAADTAEEEGTDTNALIERLRPHEASEVSAWLQGPGPDVVQVDLDESQLPMPLRTSKLT